MVFTQEQLKQVIEFRRELHRNAELSNLEEKTAELVREFLDPCGPDKVISGIGGTGSAYFFDSGKPGPTVVIRSELDAVPIPEQNRIPHHSLTKGVSHKCGHEGHMSILAGLGLKLSEERPKKGRVVLLFQPAEETGEGAIRMVEDEKFKIIEPDYVFALHNLPGVPLGRIPVRGPVSNCASRGMIVTLKGVSSHAAMPEEGKSPAIAMADIIRDLSELPDRYDHFCLVTLIYAHLGEIAFGTTPEDAQVMATLRTEGDEEMQRLVDDVVKTVSKRAEEHDLSHIVEWRDVFPSTTNDGSAVEIVEKAAVRCGLKVEKSALPFRWSEDFGHFTARYKGALFGLGAGEDYTPLHNPAYDFPDGIIDTGAAIFSAIIEEILE